MIKRIVFLLLVTASIFSCSKDSTQEVTPTTPTGSCDTLNVTFSAKVVPILQQHCNSCHSGSHPSGGLRLDTYLGVRDPASDGELTGTIEHKPGYRPMPPSGAMSDCDINTIKIWVRNGYPNN